jgi:hypothetical protein
VSGAVSIQCRVVRAKRDEVVAGPDDAPVVVTVAKEFVGLDPTVAYMQGKLKAAGPSGLVLDALRSGAVREALASITA